MRELKTPEGRKRGQSAMRRGQMNHGRKAKLQSKGYPGDTGSGRETEARPNSHRQALKRRKGKKRKGSKWCGLQQKAERQKRQITKQGEKPRGVSKNDKTTRKKKIAPRARKCWKHRGRKEETVKRKSTSGEKLAHWGKLSEPQREAGKKKESGRARSKRMQPQ